MRSYSPIKDLTNRVTPARGQVVTRDRIQSGPFALMPYSTNGFALGAGSKIIFGEKNWGVSSEFNLSLKVIDGIVPGNFIVCKINFSEGLPLTYDIEILNEGDEIKETEYSDDKWPSPKNVKSMSFLIAVVYNYNENLKNIYGDSIIDGPPFINNDLVTGSYSALRVVFSCIRIVQTCYGFMLVPTTTF